MRRTSSFIQFLIRESTALTIVVLNGLVLFLDAFPTLHAEWHSVLYVIDYGCLVYFVVEAVLKIREFGFSGYWSSNWNRFDFWITFASLPFLASPFLGDGLESFSMLLVLRMGRLVRFFRIMRFVPNAAQIWSGVVRSLKASVGIFLVLVLLNFILGMGASTLFGDLAPEYFGDPWLSIYSIFKVFTVEGWYDIPETLAANGVDGLWLTILRGYFVFCVLTGGILGLSLANAIFVDEMTADNTRALETEMAALRQDVADLRTAGEQQARVLTEIRRLMVGGSEPPDNDPATDH